MTLGRRVAAEGIGTAFLFGAVVGSGIMGERLAGGSVGLALLANSLATGAALIALILSLGPVSGAHFNPVVSVVDVMVGRLSWPACAAYVAAQMTGAVVGVAIANAMFGEPLVAFSQHVRSGGGQLLGELVATFGLVGVILGCARTRPGAAAWAVGSYIAAAYWFTSSTSFANPAGTIARSLTSTFAGIRPGDVPGFVIAQIVGGVAAALVFEWLLAGVESPGARP
jgi:glycerol uptake facilitator-like aquaporin